MVDLAARVESPPAPTRMLELDVLRAGLMLSGLVLHSAWAFQGAWAPWVRDTWSGWEVLTGFLRVWRMPLFFLLSGMLAATVLPRHGVRRWTRRRVTRLGVPLAF